MRGVERVEWLGAYVSLSASAVRAKCWSKGGNSASCLGVLMDYKLAGVHWHQMNKREPSILNEDFPSPLACLV